MRGRAGAGAMLAALALSCGAPRATRDAIDGRRGACPTGLYIVDGACLSPREIDAFCGARSLGGSCVWPACAPGEALDPHADACLSQRTVRAIVASTRPTPLVEGARIGCGEDHLLIADDDHAVCLDRGDTCPRGAHADPPRGCVATARCPQGEVRAGAQCVQVAHHHTVDVGAWTRAVLGGDGGPGDARVCGALTAVPWDFDVGPGGSRGVALAIDLRFPNNDVTSATATVTADAPSAGLRTAEAAVDALLIPLRALGGATDAASASVHLMCAIHGGSSPRPVSP